MVMIKIGRQYYDVSIAWPLIIFALMLGMALLVPAVARLLVLFDG